MHLMNYRARVVGGALEVERAHNGGTVVMCMFPIGPKIAETSGVAGAVRYK